LHEIALGVKSLLDPKDGRFIFEVQYLIDMIDNTLFDMVYHEHLSYHSLTPLISFFNRIDMKVTDVKRIKTHGGSIRVTVSLNTALSEVNHSVENLVELELKTLNQNYFTNLNKKINIAEKKLKTEIKGINGKIVGYGAPAKLTTLMYRFNLNPNDFNYIVDDSPWKQGLYTPGLHIPVFSSLKLLEIETKPDYIVIFAWNFADSIANKFPNFSGKFIVPLPIFRRL
jgi:hypothetical protein